MTRTREPIEPTLDMPLSAAAEELTGFEVIGIQKRFGELMDNMGGARLLMGVVWAYENRGEKTTAWTVIESMTMRQLRGYFESEPDDEESPLGNG